MTNSFTFAVVSLNHALIWKGQLEPGSKPLRLDSAEDNPDFLKEHDGRIAGRERSIFDNKFAEKISQDLMGASHIFLVSAGSGKSNTAHQLLEYLKEKHPKVAAVVLELGTADVNGLTENQLLELGRNRKELFIKTGL
jgi:hypothetical protein